MVVLWFFYSLFEGLREGFYWREKKTRDNHYEHVIWSIQRALVLILVSRDIIILLGCMCVFPFLHDGMYYTTRYYMNKNIYKKTFFDQSETSTAVLTKYFTPYVRLILFIIGVLLWIKRN